MPQSLVHEFLDQRASGNKLAPSLKEAIFQAKPPDIEAGEVENAKPKFKLWKVHLRGYDDEDPVNWWFASTGIPILAATLGPLANVLSIGALVTSWRVDLEDPANPGTTVAQMLGSEVPDPRWCYGVNLASLILGFIGNLFLLLNFTQRVRYLIALPVTIVLWFIACGMLIGDLSAMHMYSPPSGQYEIFSGGFWYSIAAACMYLILTMLLMVNMVGYIRGHYPQYFRLTEDQRTLIVQTMLFFIWLAGGAGVYSRIEGWHYIDALYYCDVTILTVGFGDLFPLTTVGKALIIPYSVSGIIMLGLTICAIYKSVEELGEKKIVRHHFEVQREKEKGRTVRSSLEMHRREIEMELASERLRAKNVAKTGSRSSGAAKKMSSGLDRRSSYGSLNANGMPRPGVSRQNTAMKGHQRIILLREEKERFQAMRKIQKKSQIWRNWYRLSVTITIFALFWCIGAVIFWAAEKGTTQQSYFDTIYFCWIALLSIGYGDYSPKTGSGRCFFIIWSLIAVPTMTILASDLTTTVVSVFSHWSDVIAEFTVMPEEGLWRRLIDKYPWAFIYIPTVVEKISTENNRRKAEKKREKVMLNERAMENGLKRTDTSIQREDDEGYAAGTQTPDLDDLMKQQDSDKLKNPDATALARQLAFAIRRTAHDLMIQTPRAYSYEEWAEFTRLIRFSAVGGPPEGLREEDEEGMIEWDWIGADSPMMGEGTETQFVLDRLVESLVRYLRRNPPVPKFAETLRETGEDALKLKGGTAPGDDDPESETTSLFTPSLRSHTGSAIKGREGEAGTLGGLHPVEEHEDEHIHPAPHRKVHR